MITSFNSSDKNKMVLHASSYIFHLTFNDVNLDFGNYQLNHIRAKSKSLGNSRSGFKLKWRWREITSPQNSEAPLLGSAHPTV